MTMMPCVNKPLLRYSRAIFRPPGTCLRPGARPKAKRAWFTLEAREMVSGFPGIVVHKPKVRPFFSPRVSHFLKVRTLLRQLLLLFVCLVPYVHALLNHRDVRAVWF